MPLMDITNPYIIKFLVENYEKTAKMRMKWNNIHREKLNKAANLQREEKGYNQLYVLKVEMESGMLAITRDNKSNARNRRPKPVCDLSIIEGVDHLKKRHSIADIGLGDPETDPRLVRPDTDLSMDPIMRPISPKQQEILYKGRPVFGREVYLKKRVAAAPEDRYYFAESSGWHYGWRLKDSYFGNQKSQYGRVYNLAREQSRTGPNPDPVHYREAGYQAGVCVLE